MIFAVRFASIAFSSSTYAFIVDFGLFIWVRNFILCLIIFIDFLMCFWWVVIMEFFLLRMILMSASCVCSVFFRDMFVVESMKVGSVVVFMFVCWFVFVVDFWLFMCEGVFELFCGGVDWISDCRVASGVDVRGVNVIVRGFRVGVDVVVNDGGVMIGFLLLVLCVSFFIWLVYCSVLSVCLYEFFVGEMFAIIIVREFFKNEFWSIFVSFDLWNGMCDVFELSVCMYFFSVSRDLLIFVFLMWVCWLLFVVFVSRSFLVKFIKESLLKIFVVGVLFGVSVVVIVFWCFNLIGFFSMSCNIVCDWDDFVLVFVLSTYRVFVLCSTSRSNVSSALTRYFCNLMM